MFEITPNKTFTVNDTAEIHDIAKKEITAYLEKITGIIRLFPCYIDWNWDINPTTYYCNYFGKKKFNGSLAKRIRKFLSLVHDFHLSENQMGELGDIIGQIKNRTEKLICQFVDHFDWEAGDFGDNGSCFWSCHRLAKEILLDNGAQPLLFYDEDMEGFGRAITLNRKNHLIIFNAYGLSLKEIAIIMADYYKCKYEIMQAINNYDDINLVYINHNQAAVLYYDEEDIEYAINDGAIDLEVEVGDDYTLCSYCEKFYHIDDLTSDGENNMYCEECLEHNVDCFTCEDCNELYIGDHHETCYVVDEEMIICESCFSSGNYYICAACGDINTTKNMYDYKCDSYCEACYEELIREEELFEEED